MYLHLKILYLDHVIVFLTKTKKSNISLPKLPHIHFHFVKGIRVPYYKEIKVPFLSYHDLSKHILSKDEGEYVFSLFEPFRNPNNYSDQ